MATVGYARVSSVGQSLEVQLEQLRAAGVEKVFSEKQSGTTTNSRPALAEALEWVRDGDVFVVTRIDRLARSVIDLERIVRELGDRGVVFRSLMQGEFDTSTSTSKLLLQILGVIAEFETALRAERVREGTARAKAEGKYKHGRGGKPKVNVEEALRLRAGGMRPADIARELKVARPSLYRALAREDAKRTATDPA